MQKSEENYTKSGTPKIVRFDVIELASILQVFWPTEFYGNRGAFPDGPKKVRMS